MVPICTFSARPELLTLPSSVKVPAPVLLTVKFAPTVLVEIWLAVTAKVCASMVLVVPLTPRNAVDHVWLPKALSVPPPRKMPLPAWMPE